MHGDGIHPTLCGFLNQIWNVHKHRYVPVEMWCHVVPQDYTDLENDDQLLDFGVPLILDLKQKNNRPKTAFSTTHNLGMSHFDLSL